MSNSSNSSKSSGGGMWMFGIVTFVVFLVLKLTDVIAWSWIWVCSPLLVCLGLVIIGTILASVLTIIALRQNRNRFDRYLR